MQPFTNPNYYSQYQQPYQNQFPSYPQQSFQPRFSNMAEQQRQMPGLTSGLVDSFETITANDVPMDGSPAVFVKRDGTEIELRQWGADGQIRKTVYKPKLDDFKNEVENATPDMLQALNDRFNDFEKAYNDRFEKLEKVFKTNRKKEVVENE